MRPTNADENALRDMFGPWAIMSLAVVMPCSWEFAAATLSTGIFGGGPPVEVWGSLAVGVSTSIFCLILAECGSAYPHAAGCTYIASQVAGPKYGRICSYIVGWLHALGVIVTGPALIIALLQLVVSCVQLFYDFELKKWQLFLIYQAVNIFFTLSLKYGTTLLPLLTLLCSLFFIGGLLVTIGVLTGLSGAKASNSFVWTDFVNGSGFDSDAMGALIGILGAMIPFGPVHFLLNMAEDIKDAPLNLPRAIAAQQIGNTVCIFSFFVAGYYSISDFTNLIGSTFESVVVALYLQATGHPVVALILTILLLIPLIFGTLGYISAMIRLLYGFARCNPVPGQSWLQVIDQKNNVPVNMLYLTAILNVILSFVYLGSEIGFNILLQSASIFFATGYIVTVAPLLLTRRKYLKPGYFSLPPTIGILAAAWAVVYESFCIVVYCLPTSGPLTTKTFNYSPALLLFGVLIIIISWYAHGKKNYLEEMDLDVISASDNAEGGDQLKERYGRDSDGMKHDA